MSKMNDHLLDIQEHVDYYMSIKDDWIIEEIVEYVMEKVKHSTDEQIRDVIDGMESDGMWYNQMKDENTL